MRYQKRRFWKYRLYSDETYDTNIFPTKLVKTEFIHLGMNGVLVVKRGYVWDGASFAIDTKNTMLASLIHDALYQLMRGNYIIQEWRVNADQILYDILIEKGMWKIRARAWYRAVRRAAGNASKYDVLTAP